jgi:hypothetical protein
MTADQLKRLAEVLPVEMDAMLVGSDVLTFIDQHGCTRYICVSATDIDNAEATIALLDAMRKAEAEEVEALHADGSRDGARINQIREALDKITWRTLSTESVVAAAIAVFGGESEEEEG